MTSKAPFLPALSYRIVLTATLVSLLVAVGSTAADAAESETGEVTDLGIAMHAPNVRLSDVGYLADGSPVAYLFSDGEPVSFNVVDLRSGELLDSHEISPYSVASAIDVADDGTVYLSVRSPNDGALWRYQPDTGELAKVATGIAGEEMLRTLDIHGDTLYGTTYPNAQVYALDLESEEITEYGSVTDDGDYAWGLEANADRLLIGAGTPAQLYELDLGNGEFSQWELAEDVVSDGGFVQRIETYDDLTVFSHRAVEGGSMSVHDGSEWLDRVPVGGMWLYTEQTADGAFYYLNEENEPVAFDIATRTSSPISLSGTTLEGEIDGSARIFLAELKTDEFPGSTLVGTRTDGGIWRYNLETGNADVLAPAAFGSPVTIMSLAEGGDGQLYVGAYLSPGIMARVDPTTDDIEQLSGPEQADSIVANGTRTIIGTYPEAEFYAAEAEEIWSWGDNPRHLFTLGRNATGQDRPRHMTAADDLVAAGTIPNYGELGGALTLFDPETGTYDVHRDVVEDQSVTDLVYAEGIIIAGTSIHGGLDTMPTQDAAVVFAWDVDEQELVASGVAVEGAEVIHSLALDADGRVWGMADTGGLFEYDPVEHEVIQVVDTGMRHGNVWGTQGYLEFNPDDGLVYGVASGRLFRFDPDSPEPQILVDSGVQRAALTAGDLFYANDTNIFRYSLAPSALIEVEPAPVEFVDEPGVVNDVYRVPESEGVEYVLDGEVIETGAYSGAGTVTISARAVEGYVLADGAVREWSHTFDAAPATTPPHQPTEPEPGTESSQTPDSEPGEMPDTGVSATHLILASVGLIGSAAVFLLLRHRSSGRF